MNSEIEKVVNDTDGDVLSIIHTKAELDQCYPTFILASTAAAMDKKVELFFTFYGIKALLKDVSSLNISPLNNPSMVMKSPVGPYWFRKVDLNRVLPRFVWVLPGMNWLATLAFKKTLKQQGQMPISELREICADLDVKFTICSMTMEMMGYQESDFIDGVEFAGAATYFANTPKSQSLFI